MESGKMRSYLKGVLENMPSDWLKLTTHRLDIYDEKLAKTQFLEQFESLFQSNNSESSALSNLPTAFDYIRLGHPLSSLLEWTIAKLNSLAAKNVISFSSQTIPVLAILRTNLLANRKTQLIFSGEVPAFFDEALLRNIYGYQFDVKTNENPDGISDFDGSTIYISQKDEIGIFDLSSSIDFYVSTHAQLGSILLVNGEKNEEYISDIQHVRRRETIAMTPADCLAALHILIGNAAHETSLGNVETNKKSVVESISEITETSTKVLLGSSGLSIQYAITMGLIQDAYENNAGKAIKIIIPPNCYGGTNDQARRIAACVDNVEVLDLPVDRGTDMVQNLGSLLEEIATVDAIPFIIVEIPTNPRVEVPDLVKLAEVLSIERNTATGKIAVDPVFILDQTFCPNAHFLGEDELLSSTRTIAYISGSKFPSGGLCTAGYCVPNQKAEALMGKIESNLQLCDNEATDLQIEILAKQLPSMNQRISDAYSNTREFVNFITETLPAAKINFVSEDLAAQGFTPSVFSLDLPTKGETDNERASYTKELNYKLINLMIKEIPTESKFCVSYGQLNGSYWTIPATSTQGTTKEGDKDYIVRVSLSPNMDLALHKKVFADFASQI
ncbi:hypothetical protein N8482_03240 [Chitinophagales bacterium]|nr:hypothetical protein [Chitinophagales bacterium]